MVVEIIFNNEIQIFSLKSIYIYLKENTLLKEILILILSFGQNLNKISKIKNKFLFNVLNEVG